MLFRDDGNLRVANALNLIAVRAMHVVRCGHVIVTIISDRGRDVRVGSRLEVAGSLTMMRSGVVVVLVFAIGHGGACLPLRA
jgi:hypothetical protein